MKTLISIIIFTLFMVLSLSGQDQGKIPAVVEDSFHDHYPQVENFKWEVNERLQYEAHFYLNELPIIATFEINGKWMGENQYLLIENLPEHVLDMLTIEYGNYVLVQAEKVNTHLNVTFYKVGINIEENQWDILIDDNGMIVMSEKVYQRNHPFLHENIVSQ